MDELDLYNDSDLGYDTDWCTETIDSIKRRKSKFKSFTINEKRKNYSSSCSP